MTELTLYQKILYLCEEHGFVSDHTRDLIELVTESLGGHYEGEDEEL